MLKTEKRTITQADIIQFATLTGDHNPLHLDETYAREGMFGRIIAHGLLVQSVAVGLATDQLDSTRIMAFRALTVKFSRPVYPNDAIYVETTIADKKQMSRLNAERITLNFMVLNDETKVVQSGSWEILLRLTPYKS